jgi:hypothetical protein
MLLLLLLLLLLSIHHFCSKTSFNISLDHTLFATASSPLTQTTHPQNLFHGAARILRSSKADQRVPPVKNVTL